MTHSTGSLTVGKSPEKASAGSRILFWLLLLLLVGLPLGYAFFIFSLDNVGTFHKTAVAADFDNDGDLDLILNNVRQEAEFTAFSVTTLWFNEGNGRFTPQRLNQTGWAANGSDVDQDGDVDLLIFDGIRLKLLLNQGGAQGGEVGTFANGGNTSGPEPNGQIGSILVGDVNRDGQNDAFVAACCGRVFTLDAQEDTPNQSWLWRNDWSALGTLSIRTEAADALHGLALQDAALGDLDGDGDLDLFAAVIASQNGRNTNSADRVLWNDGAGNFSDSGQRLGHVDSTAVALSDVDGDGDLDALTGHASGATLWLNEGGAFVASGQKLDGGAVTAVFLQDLDGDGDADALIGELRQARIWWNAGDGTFSRDAQRFRYSRRAGLVIGDFSGNGRPDILTAAYDDDYHLWFNQGNGVFR